MGNARREAKGSFFLIDAKEWKVKGIHLIYFSSYLYKLNVLKC